MFISNLFAIAAVLVIGVISPGPSFIYVARNAVARSRLHGLVTALGTGTGAAIFALMAMLGLQKVLEAVPDIFACLKVGGGMYLLWLAFKIFKGASHPIDLGSLDTTGKNTLIRTFRDGLLTQLSNPKTALIFASIFSALLPKDIPHTFYYLVPLMSFLIDAGWYSLVAFLLSSEGPRRAYLRMKRKIDLISSAVLGLLGIRLIFTSLSR